MELLRSNSIHQANGATVTVDLSSCDRQFWHTTAKRLRSAAFRLGPRNVRARGELPLEFVEAFELWKCKRAEFPLRVLGYSVGQGFRSEIQVEFDPTGISIA